jgi:hypothetical protein
MMLVPWIRVHGELDEKPVTTRLMGWAGIGEHEAIGVLVVFWSKVAKHCTNGVIRGYSDAQIEKWAKWRRKRGVFAAWVRAEHMDADGRVPEWDEYAGKLEVIRDKDKRRKANKRRGISNGLPPDSPQTSPGSPDPRAEDVDVDVDVDVDETLTVPPPAWAGRAVIEFLDAAPPDQRGRWVRTLDGWRNGLGYVGGKAAQPADIEVGLTEYLLVEKAPDFSARHVVAYVEKAEKRRTKTSGTARRSIADDAEANALAGALAIQERMGGAA